MTRAAFTSACGDPFILLLCIKLFQERFYNEIDKYYIGLNNHSGVPKEVIAKLLSTLSYELKIQIIYHPNGIGNGLPITEMTLVSKEDLIVLIEDDFFIFTSGKINECFQKIEVDQCDVVGSPRGSCGQEITDASVKKYNLDLSGYGDRGVNFWPAGFFCKRKDLLRTDLNFASKTWQAGEYSKELDHTFKEINHGDTFVWACVQLRHLGLRFHNVPQFHASPTEPEDRMLKVMNWKDEEPYWIHGGSLSSGWGGYLNKSIPSCKTDMEKREMESRCAFWTIACDTTEGFEEFKKEYKAGIANLINKGGLEPARVQDKVNIYRSLMKL